MSTLQVVLTIASLLFSGLGALFLLALAAASALARRLPERAPPGLGRPSPPDDPWPAPHMMYLQSVHPSGRRQIFWVDDEGRRHHRFLDH